MPCQEYIHQILLEKLSNTCIYLVGYLMRNVFSFLVISKEALGLCKQRIELIANTLQLQGFSRIDAFVNVDSGEVCKSVFHLCGHVPRFVSSEWLFL